jgi:hypothetical protein
VLKFATLAILIQDTAELAASRSKALLHRNRRLTRLGQMN